jgi:hypothetical protein
MMVNYGNSVITTRRPYLCQEREQNQGRQSVVMYMILLREQRLCCSR